MQQSKFWLWSSLSFATVALFLLNISLGSVSIPLRYILAALFGGDTPNEAWQYIIYEFRIPKAITAVLAGAGLSISGLQMQTLFRNPLAGPFVLGISSGASLGVALLILAGFSLSQLLGLEIFMGSGLQVIAATLGAAFVLLLVMLVSLRIRDSMTLLIVGLMFGSATGALVSVLQFFSDKEQLQEYLLWTFGSLGGLSWQEISVFVPTIFLGVSLSIFFVKPLNAFLLGEHYAQSMGVNLKTSRFWIIISTSILAGSITAFCGPIAFIGIAVPHLTRLLINTANHKILIPAVAFCGAILMLFCDIIAQLPFSDSALPINIITSLIGAPIVIWVILRGKNVGKSFSQ